MTDVQASTLAPLPRTDDRLAELILLDRPNWSLNPYHYQRQSWEPVGAVQSVVE